MLLLDDLLGIDSEHSDDSGDPKTGTVRALIPSWGSTGMHHCDLLGGRAPPVSLAFVALAGVWDHPDNAMSSQESTPEM